MLIRALVQGVARVEELVEIPGLLDGERNLRQTTEAIENTASKFHDAVMVEAASHAQRLGVPAEIIKLGRVDVS